MANTVRSERFVNATIDLTDMTITEYNDDGAEIFSINEMLNRWDGVPCVTLTICSSVPLPPDGREAD